MRKMLYLIPLIVAYFACSTQPENPFLTEWDTPFETPPFNEIKNEHFLPAFKETMKMEKAEIDAIVNNPDSPTFKNTIEAYEKCGEYLSRVSRIFGSLNSANTNDELQKISKELAPIRSKHRDDIYLNEKLFTRIKQIYDNKDNLGLNEEQEILLHHIYKDFVRSGADLNTDDKTKLRTINEELSKLYVQFRQNHLAQTNAIALVIDKKEDLAGLSDEIIQAAAEKGKSRAMEGKWVFTCQKPSFIPFLESSEKREFREKVFKAYVNRGNNNDEFDNKKIISEIASLRVQRANLLGYKTHAEYILEKNMAKNPQNVYDFLNDLWEPAIKRAKLEVKDMQTLIKKEGKNFKLETWDWWYYAEKVKKEKYALDESMLRPYLKMENVRKGAFDVAEKLYEVKFAPRKDIQIYHPDVEVFEVFDKNGSHLGIFYSDYYPRDGKRSGAWSSSYRSQSNIDGKFKTPINYNVGNFTKPTANKPSLLSMDEVETLFHELGHGLNTLFGNTVYSGSRRTPRDFVELPSQVMENWAKEPAVLKSYAIHYKTGEPIPDELIEKMQKAATFNQGFKTVEYLAASFLDMDWHMLTDATEVDAEKLEKESKKKMGLIHEIESRYQSTNFGHIFSSNSYSSGYYSYIWAAVLDADAFQAFKDTDLFNQELAASFRENVLSRGSIDMMEQYVKFRGSEPAVEPLLIRRGLK